MLRIRWVYQVVMLASGLTFALPCGEGRADEPKPASPEVVARYKAIFEGLAEGYASIHAKAQFKSLFIENGKPKGGFIAYDFEFFRIPDMLRVEQIKSYNLTPQGEYLTRAIGLTTVHGANQHFTVYKESPEAPFQLSSIEASTDQNRDALRRTYYGAFDAPYGVGMRTLAPMFGAEGWTLSEPEIIEREGRRLIKLVFTRGEFHGIEQLKPGVAASYLAIMVDPALNYTVQSYSSAATSAQLKQSTIFTSGTVAYEKNPNGLPKLKSMATESFRRIGDEEAEKHRLANGEEILAKLSDRMTIEFESFDFDPKPATFFDITAFGLTEETKSKPLPRPTRKRAAAKAEEPPKDDKPK